MTANEQAIYDGVRGIPLRRSAWNDGIRDTAIDFVLWCVDSAPGELERCEYISDVTRLLLNGAADWRAYSWGCGSVAFAYDEDIASRYCTPSEFRRTHGGDRRPNSREEWLDVQARALSQASFLVIESWARWRGYPER